MTIVHPEVLPSSGISVTERHGSRECARLEWRISDGGDPALIAQTFVKGFGLGLPEREGELTEREHRAAPICGARMYVSAAAGAVMVGGPPGVSSPTPDIPDVVVAVYEHAPDAVPADHQGRPWRLGPWTPSWTPAAHAAAVERVREAIARGDVYQVNLVGHASAPYTGDPLPALRRITALPGARYPHLLTGDGWALACASPETLLRVRHGRAETLPIKGTRPATAVGRSELLASAKERAEHIMIVDLERNDLAQVARIGSVEVASLFAVRRWCDLWQAESRVAGHEWVR